MECIPSCPFIAVRSFPFTVDLHCQLCASRGDRREGSGSFVCSLSLSSSHHQNYHSETCWNCDSNKAEILNPCPLVFDDKSTAGHRDKRNAWLCHLAFHNTKRCHRQGVCFYSCQSGIGLRPHAASLNHGEHFKTASKRKQYKGNSRGHPLTTHALCAGDVGEPHCA